MPDFHKLTAVSLTLKPPYKRKFYTNYKNFDEDNFNKDLKLPWLKRTFRSVFLPKTLGRVLQIPGLVF